MATKNLKKSGFWKRLWKQNKLRIAFAMALGFGAACFSGSLHAQQHTFGGGGFDYQFDTVNRSVFVDLAGQDLTVSPPNDLYQCYNDHTATLYTNMNNVMVIGNVWTGWGSGTNSTGGAVTTSLNLSDIQLLEILGYLDNNGGSVTDVVTLVVDEYVNNYASAVNGTVGIISGAGTLYSEFIVNSHIANSGGSRITGFGLIESGDYITNSAGSLISGAGVGSIMSVGTTLNNSGTISLLETIGVVGNITNNLGGSISGTSAGSSLITDATLTNSGSISQMETINADTIVNNAGGTINGTGADSKLHSDTTLTNSGSITHVETIGAVGNIDNNVGGAITGTGVGSTLMTDATLTNRGSITHVEMINAHTIVNNNLISGTGLPGSSLHSDTTLLNTGTLSQIALITAQGNITNNNSIIGTGIGSRLDTNATLSNNGAISQVETIHANAISNNAGGTITGTGNGSELFSMTTLDNSGTIRQVETIYAIDAITNNTGAIITGTGAGSSMTTGSTLINDGTISAIEKIVAAGDITNNFSMFGTGLGSLLTTEGNLNNTSDIDGFHIVAADGDINNDMNLIGTGFAGSILQAGWDITNTGTIGDFETIFVWDKLTNSGDIYGTYVAGSKLLTYVLDNQAGGDISGFEKIATGDYLNNAGDITGMGAGSTLTVGDNMTNSGAIRAFEKVEVTDELLNDVGGTIAGTGYGSILTVGNLLENFGDITAFHIVDVATIDNYSNITGTNLAGSQLVAGDLTNFVGGAISKFQAVDIGNDLTNDGTIIGTGSTSTLTVGNILTNTGTISGFSVISVTGDIDNSGATITDNGLRSSLISHNGSIINVGGNVSNFETVAAKLDIDNTAGYIGGTGGAGSLLASSEGDIINDDGAIENFETIFAGGITGLSNLNGYIAGTGLGSSLTVANGGLTSDAVIENFERVAVRGNTTNSGDLTGTGSADSSFYTGTLDNSTTGIIKGFRTVNVAGDATIAGNGINDTISGTGFGSDLNVGGSLTNDATGRITNFEQVNVTTNVENSGTLAGTGGVNSLLNAGGYIYNLDGAAIAGFERIVAGGSDGAGVAIWNSTDAVSGLGSNIDGVRTIIAAGKIVNDVDASIYALVDGAGDFVPDASISAVAIDNSGEIEGFTKVNLTGDLANKTGATLIGTGSADSSILAGSINNDGTITDYRTIASRTDITNDVNGTITGVKTMVADGNIANDFIITGTGNAGSVMAAGGNIDNTATGHITGFEIVHADGNINNANFITGTDSIDSRLSASVINNNNGDIRGFLKVYATGETAGDKISINNVAVDNGGGDNTSAIVGMETLWANFGVVNNATVATANAIIQGSGNLTSSFSAFSLQNLGTFYDPTLNREQSNATIAGFNNINITTTVVNSGVIQGTYATGSSFIVGTDLPPGATSSLVNTGALIRFDLVSVSGDIINATGARIGSIGSESSALYGGSITNDGTINRFNTIASGSFISNSGIIGEYDTINNQIGYGVTNFIANGMDALGIGIANTGVIYGGGAGSLMVAKQGDITNTATTAGVDGIIQGFETVAANSDITNNANAVFQGTGTADSLFTAGGSINNSGDIADYTTVVAGHDINNLGVDSSITGVSTLEALNGGIINEGIIDGNGPGSIITAATTLDNSGLISAIETIAVGTGITNTGDIVGTRTVDSKMVTDGLLDNAGDIRGFHVVAAGDVNNDGFIFGTGAKGSILNSADDIINTGRIGDFETIFAWETLDNAGTIYGTYVAGSQVLAYELINQAGGNIFGFETVAATNGITNDGDIYGPGTIDSKMVTAGDLDNTGDIDGFHVVAADDVNNAGDISGTGAEGSILNSADEIINTGNIEDFETVFARDTLDNSGTIYGTGVGSKLVVRDGDLTNTGDIDNFRTIAAGGDIDNTGWITGVNTLVADGDITNGYVDPLGVAADVDGFIFATGTDALLQANSLDNATAGSIIDGFNNITLIGALTNAGTIGTISSGNSSIFAGFIANDGAINGYNIVASADEIQNAGLIAGTGLAGSMMNAGTTITNDGIITDYETVYAKDGITNTGAIVGTRTVDSKMVTAGDLDNTGIIDGFQVVAAGDVNNDGALIGTGAKGSILNASGDINNTNVIGDFETIVAGGDIDNTGAITGVNTLVADGDIRNGDALNAIDGFIIATGTDALLQANSLDNATAGSVIDGFNTIASATSIDNAGLIAGTGLAGSMMNAGTTIANTGDITGYETIAAADGITNAGNIAGTGLDSKLIVSIGDLDNTAGTIIDFEKVAAGGNIDNTGGVITGTGGTTSLLMSADGYITNNNNGPVRGTIAGFETIYVGGADVNGIAINNQGDISGVRTIAAVGQINNEAGGNITALIDSNSRYVPDASVVATSLDNAGNIEGFTNVAVTEDITNQAGAFITGTGMPDSIMKAGTTITNRGTITGYETIAATGSITNDAAMTGTGVDSRLVSSTGDITNTGTIDQFETIAAGGDIDNTGAITGVNTLYAEGDITNGNGVITAIGANASIIANSLTNGNGRIENFNNIKLAQALTNNGYVGTVSSADSSIFAGLIANNGLITGYNIVASASSIQNVGAMVGTGNAGSMMNAATTITNNGAVTGYETVYAKDGITNTNAITGTGTADSKMVTAGILDNSGNIDDFRTIAAGDIDNTGYITDVNTLYATGDITNGGGNITAIGADAAIIANSLTNGGGRIENFNNIKLTDALTNGGYIGTVSSADSSIFAGLITNNGLITGYNVVASASSIQNVGAMVGTGNAGSMVNAATTLANTGNITGYETVYAKDGITNTNAITGTGTADSKMVTAGLLDNSGNIDDFRTIAAGDIDNTGYITDVNTLYATGDITNGGGNITAIGADALIIANSLTNNGGRIENFNNIKLTDALINGGYVGTVNSADSSLLAGSILNNGMIRGYNIMASAAGITNNSDIFGTGLAGSMMNAGTTIANDGKITGYETVAAKTSITNNNTMTGTGLDSVLVVSAGDIINTAFISQFETIVAGGNIANSGNITGVNTLYATGDISNTVGNITAIGADASLVGLSLTNGGGNITGFNDIKLVNGLINNGGNITTVATADSSMLAGFITNNGNIAGYNSMKAATAITNNSTITGTQMAGSVMASGGTIDNAANSTISGYETIAATGKITSDGNIEYTANPAATGSVDSALLAGDLEFSGGITGYKTIASATDIKVADTGTVGIVDSDGNVWDGAKVFSAVRSIDNAGRIAGTGEHGSYVSAGWDLANTGIIRNFEMVHVTGELKNEVDPAHFGSGLIKGSDSLDSALYAGSLINGLGADINEFNNYYISYDVENAGVILGESNPTSSFIAGSRVTNTGYIHGINDYYAAKTFNTGTAQAVIVNVNGEDVTFWADATGRALTAAEVAADPRLIVYKQAYIGGTDEAGSTFITGEINNLGSIIRGFETVGVNGNVYNKDDQNMFAIYDTDGTTIIGWEAGTTYGSLLVGTGTKNSLLQAGNVTNDAKSVISQFNQFVVSDGRYSDGKLVNDGTIHGTGMQDSLMQAGQLTNNTGGLIDGYNRIVVSAPAGGTAGSANGSFNNAGTIVGTDLAGSYIVATGDMTNSGSITKFETIASAKNVNITNQGVFRGTGTAASALVVGGDLNNDSDYPTTTSISGFANVNVVGTVNNGAQNPNATIFGTGKGSVAVLGALTNNGTFGQFEFVDVTKGDQFVGPAPNVVNSGTLQEIERLRIAGNYTNTGNHGALDSDTWPTVAGSWPTNHSANATTRDDINNRTNLGVRETYVDGNFTNTGGSLNLYVENNKIDFIQANDAIINGGNVNLSGEMLEVGQNYVFIQTANGIKVMNQLTLDNPEDLAPNLFHAELKYGDTSKGRTQWDYTMAQQPQSTFNTGNNPNQRINDYWVTLRRDFIYGDTYKVDPVTGSVWDQYHNLQTGTSITGQTNNQLQIGRYLDNIVYADMNFDSDLYYVIAALDSVSDPKLNGVYDKSLSIDEFEAISGTSVAANVQNALDQLSGQIYLDNAVRGIHTNQFFSRQLANRLRSLSCNIDGLCEDDINGRTWAQFVGGAGSTKTRGGTSGYSSEMYGFMAGSDFLTRPGTRLGAYVGYGDSGVYTKNNIADSSKNRNYLMGLYGIHEDCWGYNMLTATGGYNSYEAKRHIEFGSEENGNAIRRDHTGKSDGYVVSTRFERGFDFCRDHWKIQPFLAFEYTHLNSGEVVEDEGGRRDQVTALTLDSYNMDSFISDLGARAVFFRICPSNCRPISIFAQASWIHEFADTTASTKAAFNPNMSRLQDCGEGNLMAFNSTQKFMVAGNNTGRDWANIGVGANWCLTDNLLVYGQYDGTFNGRDQFHAGSVGMGFYW